MAVLGVMTVNDLFDLADRPALFRLPAEALTAGRPFPITWSCTAADPLLVCYLDAGLPRAGGVLAAVRNRERRTDGVRG